MERLAVYTDSKYLIDTTTKWIYKWLRNGWKKYDGQPLKHSEEYRELLKLMEDIDMKWVRISIFISVHESSGHLVYLLRLDSCQRTCKLQRKYRGRRTGEKRSKLLLLLLFRFILGTFLVGSFCGV